MALVHHEKKEINAKIVYYGPGLSGKTTNVKYLFEKMKPEFRGQLKVLNTKCGKMLFFDFMRPDQIGINGYDVRFHIYTVPGEVDDFAIWKTVLKGMDGLVFVADSDPRRLPDNLLSLDQLNDYLATQEKDLHDLPCIFQCNKQDMERATTIDEMKDVLRLVESSMVPASAQKGEGVLNSLSTIVKMVVQGLREAPSEVEATPAQEPPEMQQNAPIPAQTDEVTSLPTEVEACSETVGEEIQPEAYLSGFCSNPFAADRQEITCDTLPAQNIEEEDVAPQEEPACDQNTILEDYTPTSFDAAMEDETPLALEVPECEETEPITELEESMPADTAISLSGEMEQVAPGEYRLPVTVRCGEEVKTFSINLKLSFDAS